MKEWYIARGDKKYGPYSLDEMIVLRQQRKIFEYDLVWKQGLRQWNVLIQTIEFSAQAIAERSLRAETCEVFNRRRWPRVHVDIPVLVHNEMNLWKAKTLNISQGGALIELNTPFLNIGDEIHLHFQKNVLNSEINSNSEKFSCMGKITGKRFSQERIHVNSLIQYNLCFEVMDECALPKISQWVETIIKEKDKSNTLKGA